MRTLPYSLLLLFALIAWAACRHQEGPQPQPGGPDTTGTGGTPNNPGNPPTPEDTALCFSRDILPIFVSNCAKSGCHDAATRRDGYQFTSYQTIIAKKFEPGDAEDCELYEKITENDPGDRMPPPPNAPLTQQQIALIGRWINEGAQDRGNCGPRCDSNNFAYTANIQPMMTTYCVGCHSGAAASGGIQLNTYAGVKTVAQNGRLIGAITHSSGFSPMPQGGAKLSDCQIAQVRKWIAAGAAEN